MKEKNVADRLDVLFLDTDGAIVVAELKRDQAPDTTDLQGLKYAAYCSQLTVADLIDEYARFHSVDKAAAQTAVTDHAPSLEDGELAATRIRLVARAFGPSVTTVVLWLRDLKLDIGCIEITARKLPDGNAVLTSRQLLPPPAAEDYLVKRRRREESEEKLEGWTWHPLDESLKRSRQRALCSVRARCQVSTSCRPHNHESLVHTSTNGSGNSGHLPRSVITLLARGSSMRTVRPSQPCQLDRGSRTTIVESM